MTQVEISRTIWILAKCHMNAFVFFAIFHSSDSYASPFLDQILQRIRSEKEKLLHQLQSTSLFLKCEDIRWQGSKHISWYHAIRDLKPEVHWLQPWWGGLVSSTLLKPMSTSAIVPVSCHKNYVTKYIYRCFFLIFVYGHIFHGQFISCQKNLDIYLQVEPPVRILGPERTISPLAPGYRIKDLSHCSLTSLCLGGGT